MRNRAKSVEKTIVLTAAKVVCKSKKIKNKKILTLYNIQYMILVFLFRVNIWFSLSVFDYFYILKPSVRIVFENVSIVAAADSIIAYRYNILSSVVFKQSSNYRL